MQNHASLQRSTVRGTYPKLLLGTPFWGEKNTRQIFPWHTWSFYFVVFMKLVCTNATWVHVFYLCHKHATSSDLLDLCLCFLAEELGLDDHGLVWEDSLAQNFEVALEHTKINTKFYKSVKEQPILIGQPCCECMTWQCAHPRKSHCEVRLTSCPYITDPYSSVSEVGVWWNSTSDADASNTTRRCKMPVKQQGPRYIPLMSSFFKMYSMRPSWTGWPPRASRL